MTRVQSLAASQGPLHEVLIAMLRADRKSAGQSHAIPSGARRQLDLLLDGDVEEPDQADVPQVLRPDDVAAAVLLGRALDCNREALAKLQDADTVAVIEVPTEEFVGIVSSVIKAQIIGNDAPIIEQDSAPKKGLAVPRTVVIFRGSDDGKTKKGKNDNGDLAAAMQLRCAILGIASDPDRLLPRDLVRLAGHRIVVPPLDGAAIETVIEAVTGCHPGVVDDAIARRATLENLMIAVRADLGAERSLARLTCLLDQKDGSAEPIPRLSELHGLGEARDWGLALAHDLKEYAAKRLPWSAVARGCIISGPSGTGKTSFARSLAQEASVFFIATSYAQWQAHREGHLGHVTQAIRNVFADANKNSPALIFIDEIDTIPARGSGDRWRDSWWNAINNALLESLDGFERREGVVVIAACNNPSGLDPALVRAGRLDRHIRIELPDIPALIGIFRSHLGSDLKGADLRAAALAARGHAGADVERWVRDARRKARVASRELTLDNLLDVVRGGELEWPADVRRRIAYHEAGHAVAMLAVAIGEPKALSIGGVGGLAEGIPPEMQSLTRAYIEKYLIILLAGRAGEELMFGEPTAGAGGTEYSDLARATKIAVQLEVSFGLGSYGLLYIDGDNTRDLLLFEPLRRAVGLSLDRAHAAARDLLAKHRRTLDALANALFTNGCLDHAEIRSTLADHPLTPVHEPHQPVPASASPANDEIETASLSDVGSPSAVIEP